MKINNITSTSFGYNKDLNRRLVKRLQEDAKKADQAAERGEAKDETSFEYDYLLTCNKFCNDAENFLRIYGNTPTGVDIFDVFASVKTAFADQIELKYPDLRFKETEIDTYMDEGRVISARGDDDYPWQFEIAANLGYVDPLGEYYDDFVDRDSVDSLKQNTESPYDLKSENYIEKLKALPNSDVIEKYIPSEFSPKGFKSVAGMEELKADLYDKVIYPAKHPKEAELDFAEYGKRAPRGVMLFGPPGCGKTFMAEALAYESELPLFKFKISKAGSEFIHDTSKKYQEAFDYVENCSKLLGEPCFLFMDEMDGIAAKRDGFVQKNDLEEMGTILNLIEGARDRGIIVLGATNKYDLVDPAVKRRFDEQIYIGLPDEKLRGQVIQKELSKWLKGLNLANDEQAIRELASATEGFPNSALVILANKASDRARKDNRRPISKEDYLFEVRTNPQFKIKEQDYIPDTSGQRRKIGF